MGAMRTRSRECFSTPARPLRRIAAMALAFGVVVGIDAIPQAVAAASSTAPRNVPLLAHPKSVRLQRLGIPRATTSCSRLDAISPAEKLAHSKVQCLDALRPHVDVPVSQDTLVWVAIASQNELELVDQSTGAIIGTPITLPTGSDPTALAYWSPSAANYEYTLSENKDPYILVADHGTDKVSFIDAATKQYVTSISLGGSAPTTMSIAASTTSDFAAVTDNTTGGHSRVSMIDVPGQEVFQTFPNVASTTNALGQVIFDASGNWAYVTAPTAHQVHAFECYTPSGTCSAETTLTGGSGFDPVGLAADLTTPSSATLYVTSNSSSGQNLCSFPDDGAAWGSGTTITSFGVAPAGVDISAGAQVAYVSLPSDHEVEAYSLSADSLLGDETGLYPGPMALSWDSGTLLVGSTNEIGSPEMYQLGLAPTSAIVGAFTDTIMPGEVSALAVPVAAYIYYDIVAITDGVDHSTGYINVIDSATGAIIEQWADYNIPEAVVASPNGQEVYVVDATGGGLSGTEPEVNVLSTADFGTATDPITVVYPIAQSATTPFSYSLTHAPVPKSIAISPNGDILLITDSANSDVLTMDISVPDAGGAWEGAITSVASLNGSTAETPTSIAVSPDGSYAYVTSHPSSGAGGITELSYAATGHGTYAHDAYQAGSSFATDPAHESATTLVDPLSIVVASDDRSAYVLDGHSSEPLLDQFATATNGTLATTSTDALPAGTTPVSFTMSPEDNVAYVSDSSTDKTTAIDLTAGSSTYGDSLYAETQEGTAGVTGSTPDGQYFATGNGPTSTDGVEIGSTGSGAALEFVTLPTQPVGLAISPVSSSQWLSTSLVYAGGLSWPEELGGAGNPSEPAMSSIADVNSAGTPSDAPGLSAGTNTALHSYTLSLNSFSVPDVGLPLDLTATYDSAYMAYGIDTSSSIPPFAFGWRLSTGITWTQNPDSGFFPCRITVTQADGSQIYFEPAAATFSSCSGLTYEPLPWEQDTLALSSSTCSGSDHCWIVTNTENGEQYYMDSNSSSSHQLVQELDRNGNAISFTYTSGQLTAETGSGRSISFSYPAGGTSPCPSTFNGQTIAKCMVATDPLGRSTTLMLVGSTSTGYDLEGVTLAAPSGWSTPSSTYAFSYSSHYLTNWWDPNNYASYSGNTDEATDVTYGAGHFVTQVSGPEVTNEGTAMNATFTPTTTYSYPLFDPYSGSGTVITTDANANYDIADSASLPGADVTFENYQNWKLSDMVQGYGATDASLPDSMSSNTVTTQRDPFTLMPAETINPLADTTSTSTSVTDLGITLNTYDVNANLISSETPGSAPYSWDTTTYSYNALNEPLSSTDSVGQVTSYTYSSSGQILTTDTPSTDEWTSASVTSNYYNSNGTLCASRDPNEVASYGVLTSCSTSNDTYETYDTTSGDLYYDLLSQTDPAGDVSSYYYDNDGNQCATLSPTGYASGQTLTSCPTSPELNETVILTRDVFNDPSESLAPSNSTGGTTWSYYDQNDNLVASVSSPGSPSSCNPLIAATCEYTFYSTYNPGGDEIASVMPTASSGTAGPTTTRFYDPDGTRVASVPPAGNVPGASPAEFEQVTVPNSLGTDVVATRASNLSGSCAITSTTSLCPGTTYSQTNASGEATTTFSPNSAGTGTIYATTTYNPDGSVASVTESTGSTSTSTTTYSYDNNGNTLTSTTTGTSGSGSVSTYSTTAYNPDGSICWRSPQQWTGSEGPTCATAPVGSGSQTTFNYYDSDGNLAAVSGPGSSPYEPGNTSGCNPLATAHCPYTTYYTYNQLGERVSTIRPEDAADNYPTTTLYYDIKGDVVATQGPSGNPATCNPTTSTTCADTIYRTYNANNQLGTVSYTDGTPSVTYAYNSDGTLASMTDGTGTTSYSYDANNNLTQVTNGAGATDTWSYNRADQLICESYPNGGSDTCSTSGAGTTSPPTGDVSFFYDSEGQLSSEATWTGVTLSYGYDCASNVAWVSTGTTASPECTSSSDAYPTAPSGASVVTTSYGFDPTSDIQTSQTTTVGTGSTNLLGFAFGYDALGRLTSSTPTTNATTLNADIYGFDSESRVNSGPIVGTSGSTSYSYAPANGIVADTNAFATAGYAPSGELCWNSNSTGSSACSATPSPETSYTYNADEERTATTPPSGENPEIFAWNVSSGELTCANTDGTTCSTSSPTASTFLYTYDGAGLRATATNQGATNTFTWSALSQQLLADSSHDYIYGIDQSTPMMQIETSGFITTPGVDLIVDDTNHNARGVIQLQGDSTSDNDQLVNYTDYDAYGNPITESGGTSNPGGLLVTSSSSEFTCNFGFGSSYNDSSNLDYLTSRYYDPTTGQFLSLDPDVASTGSPYNYSGDDPVMMSDPSGSSPQPGRPQVCGLKVTSPLAVNCLSYATALTYQEANYGVVQQLVQFGGVEAKHKGFYGTWGSLVVYLAPRAESVIITSFNVVTVGPYLKAALAWADTTCRVRVGNRCEGFALVFDVFTSIVGRQNYPKGQPEVPWNDDGEVFGADCPFGPGGGCVVTYLSVAAIKLVDNCLLGKRMSSLTYNVFYLATAAQKTEVDGQPKLPKFSAVGSNYTPWNGYFAWVGKINSITSGGGLYPPGGDPIDLDQPDCGGACTPLFEQDYWASIGSAGAP